MELIRIEENNGKKAVSARELHNFLGSKQQFADWIKSRIEKYDLVENEDYHVFRNSVNNPQGGRPLTEYALSIDAAKKLSMVEGNERGKQARRYFIECEKRLKAFVIPQVEMGLFELKKTVVTQGEETNTYTTTKVTPKGQSYFINKFLHSNTLPA